MQKSLQKKSFWNTQVYQIIEFTRVNCRKELQICFFIYVKG